MRKGPIKKDTKIPVPKEMQKKNNKKGINISFNNNKSEEPGEIKNLFMQRASTQSPI
jgi:hypothetical protein